MSSPSKRKLNMNRYEFGRYIANLRNEKGLSQAKWAPKMEMSFSMLNALEQGVVKHPSEETIEKISKGYRLDEDTVREVYYGSDDELLAHDKYDQIIIEIKKDKNFPLREHALRASTEEMGLNQKLYFIRVYEKLTGKKCL